MIDDISTTAEVSAPSNDVFKASRPPESEGEKYTYYEPYYDDEKQHSGLLDGGVGYEYSN
jgi:hypothetical protein